MKRLVPALLLGGLAMHLPTPARAQEEPSEATPDPKVQALEVEKQIAELEKAIAEAEKATLAAQLPTTEASGITGSVTFGEGSGYFAEVLAYRSLANAAAVIREDLSPALGSRKKVLLVADVDLAAQAQLWEIAKTRLDDAQEKLEQLSADYPEGYSFQAVPKFLPEITVLSSLLSSASDFASFFRSDLTVTNRTVTITPTAMLAMVSRELKDAGWEPVLAGQGLVRSTLVDQVEDVLEASRDVVSLRRKHQAAMQPALLDHARKTHELEVAEGDLKKLRGASSPDPARIAEAETLVKNLKSDLVPLELAKTRWEQVSSEFDANVNAATTLVTALVQGSDGKPSVVEAVAAVDAAKEHATWRILRLETSSQGGEMHVSKSAWRTRLTYVGGVAVSYLLMDHGGEVSNSGVVMIPKAAATRPKRVEKDLVK